MLRNSGLREGKRGLDDRCAKELSVRDGILVFERSLQLLTEQETLRELYRSFERINVSRFFFKTDFESFSGFFFIIITFYWQSFKLEMFVIESRRYRE